MSHLVNISDDVYEELTALKKIRATSYSDIIQILLNRASELEKNSNWDDMISKAKKRDGKFKGKIEKIDHDLIAYGVSRDSS